MFTGKVDGTVILFSELNSKKRRSGVQKYFRFTDLSEKEMAKVPQIYLPSESPCFDENIFKGKLALAAIKTLRDADKVYFMDEAKACPASGDCAWKRKAFLLNGDVVHVSEKLKTADFQCAHYVTSAGDLI